MSKVKEAKISIVAEIKEKISKAKSVVLVDYKGLKVSEDTELRRKLRDANVDYSVYKNTYVRRVFNEMGIKDFDNDLNGPSAFAFGFEDEVTAAKLVYEFGKDKADIFNIKSAFVNGKFMDKAEAEKLAKLPTKDQLYANCVCALASILRSLPLCVKAIKEKKEKEA